MDKQVEKVMDACILAGKVLMENGAEMHRVEDTMNRILAVEQGSNHAVSFVMPTGIFITSAHGSTTKMKRITKRRQNMDRIGEINRLSREFAAGKYTDALSFLELALNVDPEKHYILFEYLPQLQGNQIIVDIIKKYSEGR